ncbi:snRNA-activating protein complex subunit 3 isoform X1 [Helicoverpa armigera]|uniref:snRNA-activating protein complex subunit 3 isoform X1 n=1 Tax=Helicoverpa armigera TaxID=29058 RepID=UPI003082A317
MSSSSENPAPSCNENPNVEEGSDNTNGNNSIVTSQEEIKLEIELEMLNSSKEDITAADKEDSDEGTIDDKISNENAPNTSVEEAQNAMTVNVPCNSDSEQNKDQASQENVVTERTDPIPGCSGTCTGDPVIPPLFHNSNVQLFTEDTGPQMYHLKGNLVTAPIITKNLPKVFEYLPIHGKPQESKSLKEYYSNKIKEFVGCGLSDYEFKQLEDYCSPEHLKTGKEIIMGTNVPLMGVMGMIPKDNHLIERDEQPDLCIVKKNKMRNDKDTKGLFVKKLKYRSVRNLPFTQEVYHLKPGTPTEESPDVDLEPGKDILYRVRVYRPYTYNLARDRFTRTRHSVFCSDIILTGRHKLSDLRDRFVCHNDFDMRVDVSNNPDMLPNTKAKEVFPSGFLFINNAFYVDSREGCIDYSAPIREWALRKKIGAFPKYDMCDVRLEELVLKLGYPEVYVHQGNCEHVFLFSEIRLLSPSDPPRLYNYPCSSAIAQNQTVYCTTCAEFPAKWIVVGCARVPFDPAFFCETCFRQYLYKDGQKIGEFKAYSYRGNALNVLKPQ